MKKEHNFEHAVFKCAAFVENQADADEDWYLFLGGDDEFYIDCLEDLDDLKVISLSDFEKLAEEYSGNSYESIDDALSKIKELNNLLNNK